MTWETKESKRRAAEIGIERWKAAKEKRPVAAWADTPHAFFNLARLVSQGDATKHDQLYKHTRAAIVLQYAEMMLKDDAEREKK